MAFERWAVAASLLLSIALFGPGVSGQEATLVAQHHYDQGRQAYQEGRYEAALEHFRASLETYDSPNGRLYYARTLRELGRLAEAVAAFQLAERVASDAAQSSPRYARARDAARQEREALEPQVAWLMVQVEPEPVDGALLIGERQLPAVALGVPLPVDPGQTMVRVSSSEHEPAERSVELVAGETTTVSLSLVPRVEAPPPAEPPPAEPLPPAPLSPRRSFAGLAATGWTSLALGLIGGGLFAGFGLAAVDRYQVLEALCEGRCTEAQVPELDQGRRYQLTANISLGLGLGLAALGVTLLIIEAVRASRRPSEARAAQ